MHITSKPPTIQSRGASCVGAGPRPTVVLLVLTRWGIPVVLKNASDVRPFQYMLPQGAVEPGEVVEEAALREVREELGIPTSRILDIASLYCSYLSPEARGGPKLLLPVKVTVKSDRRCRIRLNSENKDWRLVRSMPTLERWMRRASCDKRQATRLFIERAELPAEWGEQPRRNSRPL